MKRAFSKDIFRSITHSLSRFIAIIVIVALGAGFYAGFRAVAPDMKLTVDTYTDTYHTMDLHLLSTMGFSPEDAEAIRETKGVEAVSAGYMYDGIAPLFGGDTVIRVHSLPDDFDPDDDEVINRPILLEGRWPKAENECVISDSGLAPSGDLLGETVRFDDRNGDLADNLKQQEFTVVGIVNNAYYLSFSLGTTNIGSGTIGSYLYVKESAFSQAAYSDFYVTGEGARELDSVGDAYQESIDQVAKRLESLAQQRVVIRYDQVKADAEAELNQAQSDYDAGKQTADQQLGAAKAQLDAAQQEIAGNEAKLQQGQQQLDDARTQWELGKQQYQDGLISYESNRSNVDAQFDAVLQQLDQQKADLAAKREQLETTKQQLDAQAPAIDAWRPTLQGLLQQRQQLEALRDNASSPEMAAVYQEQIDQLNQQLLPLQQSIQNFDQGMQACLDGLAQITSGEKTLSAAYTAYQEQRAAAKTQLDGVKQQLDDTKAQLDQTKQTIDQQQRELDAGMAALADGKAKYETGLQQYLDNKAAVESQLAQAQQQIADGRQALSDLALPEWYVLDRSTNVGLVSFTADADRIDALSTVFPIIFFLVAALVALTTMTRMVEEERVTIGTYKALGYHNGRILCKYLVYAGVATVVGSIIGILICQKVLPAVCWNSYRILYSGPDIISPFNLKFGLIGLLAASVCTLGATYFAGRRTLRAKPAQLMLPEAPKPGKRILLERIPFIWKRLKFSYKVTARNLFRYKKRLFMTIIGITGCTALLLTGFGIKDSVSSILTEQYDKVYQYDTMVDLKEDLPSAETRAMMEDAQLFDRALLLFSKSATISSDRTDTTMTAYVTVPEEGEKLEDFYHLATRVGQHPVSFDKNAVVLTEKLANKLKVGVGDTVQVEQEGKSPLSFTVTGITENYVYHYLYIDPDLYWSQSGETPHYSKIIAQSAHTDETAHAELSRQFLQQPDVSTVQFMKDVSASFDDMIKSLDYVILVITVCAGLLAFVVLYNLTNINVTERQREIATIKVLGFFDPEVNAYVYRETSVFTLLGCLFGLPAGVLLQRYVIESVEVDLVMFGRQIAPLSFVYAAVLTILFSVIVNLVINRKLKKISMVESLKSVD